jgi:hypothetical protein
MQKYNINFMEYYAIYKIANLLISETFGHSVQYLGIIHSATFYTLYGS